MLTRNDKKATNNNNKGVEKHTKNTNGATLDMNFLVLGNEGT